MALKRERPRVMMPIVPVPGQARVGWIGVRSAKKMRPVYRSSADPGHKPVLHVYECFDDEIYAFAGRVDPTAWVDAAFVAESDRAPKWNDVAETPCLDPLNTVHILVVFRLQICPHQFELRRFKQVVDDDEF